MSKFAQKLAAFTAHRNPKRCSPDEIESLNLRTEAVLPEAYLQFMRTAGNGIEDFLRGSDFTLGDLEGVREAAEELLREAGLKPLPPDAFVFAMHQGYQFYFFQNDGVYYYQEGADHVEKRFDSFEQFFESVVANIEQRKNASNA